MPNPIHKVVYRNAPKSTNSCAFQFKSARFCTFSALFGALFTPVFSSKTHKSYKNSIISIAAYPIFQNFLPKTYFLLFSDQFSVCPIARHIRKSGGATAEVTVSQ